MTCCKHAFLALIVVAAPCGASLSRAAFVFDTVPDLALWLKADAGVTLANGGVDVWADQSGRGNDAWAVSSTNRPLLATATIRGNLHDVLRFDGSNDVLTLGTNVDISRQDHTAFFVAARTGGTAPATGNLFGFDRWGGRAEDGWYYKFTQGQVDMEAGHNGNNYAYQLASSSQPNNRFVLGEGRFSTADTTATLWVDGQLRANDSSVSVPLNEPANTRLNIGALDYPSGSSPPTEFRNYFQGDIAEVLVFDRALSKAEQMTVRSYLADKYLAIPLEAKAYWAFRGDGTDSIGSNDLTLRDETTFVPGRWNQGLRVTNSSSQGYASAASSVDLDIAQQFSAAMWLNYDEDNNQWARAVARMQDGSNGFNVAFQEGHEDASRVVVRVLYEGVEHFVSSDDPVLTRDNFHHLAFAFDQLAGGDATDKITLWIDGAEVAVTDTSGAGGVQGGPEFWVGRGTAGTANFSGVIDELYYFHGSLTQAEIDLLQIPEPGSWLLLLSAIGCALLVRRRR